MVPAHSSYKENLSIQASEANLNDTRLPCFFSDPKNALRNAAKHFLCNQHLGDRLSNFQLVCISAFSPANFVEIHNKQITRTMAKRSGLGWNNKAGCRGLAQASPPESTLLGAPAAGRFSMSNYEITARCCWKPASFARRPADH